MIDPETECECAISAPADVIGVPPKFAPATPPAGRETRKRPCDPVESAHPVGQLPLGWNMYAPFGIAGVVAVPVLTQVSSCKYGSPVDAAPVVPVTLYVPGFASPLLPLPEMSTYVTEPGVEIDDVKVCVCVRSSLLLRGVELDVTTVF